MSNYPKDCPNDCLYCGSEREVATYPEALEAHPQRFVCGSEWRPTKVYRSPGCYEIREGKLENLLLEIHELPAPATDSDAWYTVQRVRELLDCELMWTVTE